MHLLALNSGSSSLKFGLYRVSDTDLQCLLSGEAERLGSADARLRAINAQGVLLREATASLADAGDAMLHIGQLLADSQLPRPQAIGHRIVHGGPSLREHRRIDAAVMTQLAAAEAFAPLHTKLPRP